MDESKSALSEEANKFLFDKDSQKFLTQFVVGTNKLLFYGSPAFIRNRSQLIDSHMSNLSESKQPYELITFMEVKEKSFLMPWLFLNGFESESLPLDFDEFLQSFDIITYFNMYPKYNLINGWISQFEKYISAIPVKSIVINRKNIAMKLNKIIRVPEYKGIFENIMNKLYESHFLFIVAYLDYNPIFIVDSEQKAKVLDLIDHKSINDQEKLNEILARHDFVITPIGYASKRLDFGAWVDNGSWFYNVKILPYAIFIYNIPRKLITNSDRELDEIFNTRSSAFKNIYPTPQKIDEEINRQNEFLNIFGDVKF